MASKSHSEVNKMTEKTKLSLLDPVKFGSAISRWVSKTHNSQYEREPLLRAMLSDRERQKITTSGSIQTIPSDAIKKDSFLEKAIAGEMTVESDIRLFHEDYENFMADSFEINLFGRYRNSLYTLFYGIRSSSDQIEEELITQLGILHPSDDTRQIEEYGGKLFSKRDLIEEYIRYEVPMDIYLAKLTKRSEKKTRHNFSWNTSR